MSEKNGAEGRTVGRKGRMKFRLDETFPWVVLDVLAVHEQYLELLDGYRDAEGVLKTECRDEINHKVVAFVTELLDLPKPDSESFKEEDCLTLTEAFQFAKMIADEAAALRPFFLVKSAEPPSSPESSELILSDEDATTSV